MLGTLSHDHVYELLDCIIEERAVDLVEKLKLISTLSIDYQKLIDLILEALQQMVIAKISPEASLNMDLSGESIASLAEKLNEEDIQVLYQIGLLAKRDIDLAPTISEGFEMALLRMMSFLPKTIDIKEDKKKEKSSFSFGTGVKAKEILIFCKQFATMLRAGLPVLNTLNMLDEQTKSPGMKKINVTIRKDLESGNALSKCFSNHPKIFGTIRR